MINLSGCVAVQMGDVYLEVFHPKKSLIFSSSIKERNLENLAHFISDTLHLKFSNKKELEEWKVLIEKACKATPDASQEVVKDSFKNQIDAQLDGVLLTIRHLLKHSLESGTGSFGLYQCPTFRGTGQSLCAVEGSSTDR